LCGRPLVAHGNGGDGSKEVNDKNAASGNDLNLKWAHVKLSGQNFELTSQIKLRDQISVEAVQLVSEEGTARLTSPFLFRKNPDCSFDFDFSRLDFWKGLLPIAGSGSGSIIYKNGILLGDGKFEDLLFKNHRFRRVKYSWKEKERKITMENARIFDVDFYALELQSSGDKFFISGRIGDDHRLDVGGNFFPSSNIVSLRKCVISSAADKIEVTKGEFDLAGGNYGVECMSSRGGKTGTLKATANSREFNLDFKSFGLGAAARLFGYGIPDWDLDGKLKLAAESGVFVGIGDLSVSNFAAAKNSVKVDLQMFNYGTRASAKLQRHRAEVEAELFLPVVFETSGLVRKNLRSNLLNCRVRSNVDVEKLLELPDDLSVRGLFNCDLRITGSMASPFVAGVARLQKFYVAAGELLLKNGSISLEANGHDDIRVISGEFVDSGGRKLSVAGGGKLFFDGVIPNLNVDLRLKFDKFTLFDSENSRIVVDGDGDISGPLGDLLLTGRLMVPRCELRYFEAPDADGDDDILVENDAFLCPKNEKAVKNDFCRYDVHLKCPKVKFSGNMFEMILFSDDLLLSSHQNAATLVGKLKLSEGRFNLFGKRMLFTGGYANFRREYPFDPDAFFSCRRNFADVAVRLDIKNTPGRGGSLDLSSNPPHSKDAILSRMIFGKELKYLSIGELAQLANIVTGLKRRGYLLSILNTFQDTGIIDSISFGGGERQSQQLYSDVQSSNASNSVNISAGKYIHDNVYISVNKKEEGATFDLDFSVTPQISIKANTNGEAGVSWRYRY
jgi:autotransporter translocation and assembly factor TamB